MSYPRGQMDKRVRILAPVRHETDYGQAQICYEEVACVWAWVTWVRGARAMHHGQMDVYQSIMIRCDVSDKISRFCRVEVNGRYYVIESINVERSRNECQITAFEVDDINTDIQQQWQT
jgi:head-tail adaptor